MSKLVLPRSDVQARIVELLREGEELAARTIPTEVALDEAASAESVWRDVVAHFLGRAFDDATYVQRFRAAWARSRGVWNLAGRRDTYYDDMRLQLTELKSLIRLLPEMEQLSDAPTPTPVSVAVPAMSKDSRKVFVVHGRNEGIRVAVFTFLRAIGLDPLEWTALIATMSTATPYIGEVLKAAFDQAQAVVVLFTPDDEARLRDQFHGTHEPVYETQLTPQARPNVLLEAGMALATDEARTVLVQFGELRPFSDIAGRHLVRLDNSPQRRQDLAQRLRNAGCNVNMHGTDWHTAGDLGSAS